MTNWLHAEWGEVGMLDMVGSKANDWRQFVRQHGQGVRVRDLEAVLGRSEREIAECRVAATVETRKSAKTFAELFALWHGRAPGEDEWPAPMYLGDRYEWLPPEDALLATLVGRMSSSEIAIVLTGRLRTKTADANAQRTRNSVQVRMGRIGLQSSDVVGGITVAEAARDVGSAAVVRNAIATKAITASKVGRLLVIPHVQWQQWKEQRVLPQQGQVQLSTLRERLGIASDKLSDFARMGYIPTAVRCKPQGSNIASTKFGTWFVDKEVAEKLLADRRAGRAMPWHGKPIAENQAGSYKKWIERKHPNECETCLQIWGDAGAPGNFEEFKERYQTLAHGAKRHLTMVWSPGLSVEEVANESGVSEASVRRAIASGCLGAKEYQGKRYVTRTDSTRWIARKCPTGDSEKSWVSLETASKRYMFTVQELKALVRKGELVSKVGENGPMRGVVYVLRQQCGQLREKVGFTPEEAARRVGVTLKRFEQLLEGVNWRGSAEIPLSTVQAVIKRLESREGYTLKEAADRIGKTEQWVSERVADGTVKVARAKWDQRRLYLTEPMMRRLEEAASGKLKRNLCRQTWMRLSESATLAGVSTATLIRWAGEGDLSVKEASDGARYHVESVKARARTYWQSVRFHRATPPLWLESERKQRTGVGLGNASEDVRLPLDGTGLEQTARGDHEEGWELKG